MDIQLSYIEEGTGKPLILVHGNDGNYHYFRHQIHYFSKKYRVIAIDTRGHGLSPRGNKPFTIRQFAEDLKDFMEEKNIEKAHILGFSDGGNIAMVFALNYPEKVDKLILNAANLYPSGVKVSLMIRVYLEYRKAVRKAGKGDEERYRAEMLALLVKDPMVEPGELKKLKMKTLVIAGTKDLIKRSHTRLIAKNIEGSRLVFVKGGHGIAAENWKDYNKQVMKFLRG